jgi:hypothetical protein
MAIGLPWPLPFRRARPGGGLRIIGRRGGFGRGAPPLPVPRQVPPRRAARRLLSATALRDALS